MRRSRIFLTISMAAVILALCFMPMVASAEDDEMEFFPWSMKAGDARHSGVSPYVMEEMPKDVLWERSLDSIPEKGIAIGPDGTIYIVHDRSVNGLGPDGQWVWTYETEEIITSPIAMDLDGSAYFTTNEFDLQGMTLISIDIEGQLRWEVPLNFILNTVGTGDMIVGVERASSPVVDQFGNVYIVIMTSSEQVGVQDTFVLISFSSEGAEEWRYSVTVKDPLQLQWTEDPAVDTNGNVLFSAEDRIHALNDAGSLLWTFALPRTPSEQRNAVRDISLDPDGNCYFISKGTICSIDADGVLRWDFQSSELQSNTIAFTRSEGIIVESRPYNYELDAIFMLSSNGDLVWSYDVNLDAYSGDVTVGTANGLTLLCANDALVAIDPQGDELWRSDVMTPDDPEAVRTFVSPVLGENDTLYVFAFEDFEYSIYAVGNWLHEAFYNLVLLFSLAFAPFFIIAACYFYFRDEETKK